MLKAVLVVLTVLIGISALGTAFAIDFVSIIPSRMCELTDCISIEELLPYDNSNQYISGKFVFNNETGDYERQKGFKNSLEFYRMHNEDLIIFVTPDDYTLTRSKQVIIEPSLEEYVLPTQKVKTQVDSLTDVRYTSSGIYANESCNVVTIGIQQVNVTYALDYMMKGCQGGSNPQINEHKTEKTQMVYCGLDCQYKKFLEEALKLTKEFQIGKRN